MKEKVCFNTYCWYNKDGFCSLDECFYWENDAEMDIPLEEEVIEND